MTNRQKWDYRFIDLAAFVGSWSKDPSTKVGAVIVDTCNRVVSLGFNGFAAGVKDTEERLNNRDLKYPLTIHAELNAILTANRSVQGCRMYVYPLRPCAPCAAVIVQSGIYEVVTVASDNPRWNESNALAIEQFQEAGVAVRTVNPL